MKRILIFTPRGENNGAEMQLLHLLRKVDASRFEWCIVQFGAGRIFREAGYDVHVMQELANSSLFYRMRNFLSRNFFQSTMLERKIRKIHETFKPDFWYINSLNVHDVSVWARQWAVRYVVHCHELPYYYGYRHSSASMYNQLHHAALVIGCSERVTQNMRIMGALNAATVYECIDFDKVKSNSSDRRLTRKKLGIPEDAFVWGMAGGGYYRKGVDLIPAALKEFTERMIYFIWIGNLIDSGYSHYVKSLFNAEGISNFIITGNQTKDYYKYMDALDGFLLTSREDPFPLVMIEAAALGKPIVSFASGGVQEFMQSGMGFVIDTFNPSDLSVAMKIVVDESDCFDKNTLISRAQEFDAARIALLWTELLMSV